jgi:hypothetical protein
VFNKRSFCHCLRALAVVGEGKVAESTYAQTLVRPFLASAFTQGRIDGPRRGSWGGLPELYKQTLSHIFSSCYESLSAAEDLLFRRVDNVGSATAPGVDLVIHGVWAPVYETLTSSTCAQMFNVYVASTLHANYCACLFFMGGLENILGPDRREALRSRFNRDPTWKDLRTRVWPSNALCIHEP